MTGDYLKLPEPCPRMFARPFADNAPIGNIIYAPSAPRGWGTRRSPAVVLSKSTRFLRRGKTTLSAFILLLTFMCISRHDRRDNRARCIIVNVSQFLLLRVVLASHCRLSFHNRPRAPVPSKVINYLSERLRFPCERIRAARVPRSKIKSEDSND